MEQFQEKQSARMGRTGNRPLSVLVLSIAFRALHQVGAAVFLTSYLHHNPLGLPRTYLALAVGSGIALFAAEALRHRQICREVSGLCTALKLLLLGAAVHGWLPPMPAVLAAFVLSSLGAHAPKVVRHRLLF